MASKLGRSFFVWGAALAGGAAIIVGASGGCATAATDDFATGGTGTTSSTKASTTHATTTTTTSTHASTTSATTTTTTTSVTTNTATSTGTSGVCGNGICSADEDCNSCPADCTCGDVCGDGLCGQTEDCNSCPADCTMGCGSMSTGSGTAGCDPCMVGGTVDPNACAMGSDQNSIAAFFVCFIDDPTCCTGPWTQQCKDYAVQEGATCP